MSSFVGHFVSSPSEREKMERIASTGKKEIKEDEEKNVQKQKNNLHAAPSSTCCKYNRSLPPLYHPQIICKYAFQGGTSDLIISGLVTNGTAKICCRGLILALFYSTVVIKNDFG